MIQAKFTLGATEESRLIRTEVFINEQGFVDEFDEEDHSCVTLVLFLDGVPIATGRLIKVDPSLYQIGRLAVRKPFRGKKVGSYAMAFLKQKAKELGAKQVRVHAQADKMDFYRKNGFRPNEDGEIDYEQGVAHIFMYAELHDPKRRWKRK